MRSTIWLFIIALCLISCSNSPSSRISASRTPVPQKIATAIAFEPAPTPQQAATPEPATVLAATPEAPAGPDVHAILGKAISIMAGIGTFHFAMERQFFSDVEATELSGRIPVNGKFNAPDRIQGTIILKSHEKTAVLDFIIIGEEIYLREQNSDSWQLLDWQSQAAQVVRENAYLPLEQFSMDNFHEPVLLGEARLGGLPVYHIRSDLGQPAEGQTNPGAHSIQFWIGKENYLIYRAISEIATGNADELALYGRSVVQVDYARFGEPVLIVAPQIDTSGGYRPTGSYPTVGMLKSSPGGGTGPDIAEDQFESSEPAVGEVASNEDTPPPVEGALD